MGKSYSVNGYLNATLRRSSKTILVEGSSDKHILHKVEHKKHPARAGTAAIDHAGMLSDVELSGLGNKARVLFVRDRARALTEHAPRLAHVLATLVDREWDGLVFAKFKPTPDWTAPSQTTIAFVTQGHSTENYHFDVRCAQEFLTYFFPEHATPVLLEKIKNDFSALIVLATVYSLAIHEINCISRCTGIITPSLLVKINERYYLDNSVANPLSNRGIANAISLVDSINSSIDEAYESVGQATFAKWLPHGHLGEELLWAGLGKIALDEGLSGDIVNSIARGNQSDRFRFKSQWIAGLAEHERIPLDATIEWLHS